MGGNSQKYSNTSVGRSGQRAVRLPDSDLRMDGLVAHVCWLCLQVRPTVSWLPAPCASTSTCPSDQRALMN